MEAFLSNTPRQTWTALVQPAADIARMKIGPEKIEKFGPDITRWTVEQAAEFTDALIDAYLTEVDCMFGFGKEAI